MLKPTKRQIHGGLLGTLAAIGIPMAIELASKILEAALGKAANSSKAGEKELAKGCKLLESWNRPAGFAEAFFMATSPFYGTWEGQGRGAKGKGTFIGGQQPIQPHPHLGSNSLRRSPGALCAKGEAKMKDIPLSNFDLLKWVDFLKIKNFKGIISRDSKDHLHKTGSCIINLDDKIGNGTHWGCNRHQGKNVFYFDSFSMPPPMSLFHMQKELENRSSSLWASNSRIAICQMWLLLSLFPE